MKTFQYIKVTILIVCINSISNQMNFAQDLILTDQRLQYLQQEYQNDPILRQYVDRTIEKANTLLSSSPPSSGSDMLWAARYTKELTTTLGFAYRWTSNTTYAAKTREVLMAVCSFSSWNPSHFLDAAEMGLAVSLGMNWTEDYLSESDMNTIRQALINKTLSEGIQQMNSNAYWTWIDNNWNIICNTGMIITALAVESYDNYYSNFILPKSINNLQYPLSRFSPDGTWYEGMDYMHQIMEMYSLCVSSLMTFKGDDYGLLDYTGLAGAGSFYTSTEGKNSKWLCYSDIWSNASRALAPSLFFLGSTFNDDEIIANEHDFIAQKYNNEVFHVIWYATSTLSVPSNSNKYYGGDFSFVFLNEEVTDNNAIYLGIKAGRNGTSHGHLDIGNFEFDALGVRWARDIGGDDYSLPGYFDFENDGSQRWTYYRTGSLSHNVPIINNSNQLVSSQGYITEYSLNANDPYCIMDLQNSYRNYASSLNRGIKLVDNNRSVIVQDEYELNSTQNCYWGITTDAQIQIIDSKSVVLTQNGQQLYATLISPSNGYFEIQNAIQNAGAYSVSGIRRLVAQKPSDGVLNFTICVQLSPNWNGYHTSELGLIPLDLWGNDLPYPPTNFQAQAVSTTQIDLSWEASANGNSIEGYNIYRDNVLIDNTSDLSYSDQGLNPETEYRYEVSAVDVNGNESNRTNEVIVSTFSNPDNEPPSAPSNLTGVPVSASRINLMWNASSDNVGVVGYIIYRNDIEIGQTVSLEFSDLNLNPGTSYEYTVTAFDQAGNESNESNHVIITTFSGSDSEPPTQPQNLTAYEILSTEVKLSWSAATDNVGVEGYNIYRDGVHIYTTISLNYVDNGLTPSTSYTYTVTAFDLAGNESIFSSSVIATTLPQTDYEPPSTPLQFEGEAVSSSEIVLSWLASTDNVGVAGYNIFRNGVQIYASSELSYVDIGLNPETVYTYSVTAYDQEGNESEHSTELSIMTLQLENIIYIDPMDSNTDPPDGSIDAPFKSWSQVEWIEGYQYLQKRNTTCYEPKILVTTGNIFIGSYGWGERAKIVTTASDYAFSIYEKSNIVFSQVEIVADGAISAVYFAGTASDSNRIDNCKISGGDFCLRIVGGDNFQIRYNELSANVDAIYSMASNTDIFYNEFTNSQTAIYINDYSSEAKIYNNVFKANQECISSSYGGLTLFNNIFVLDIPGSVAINQSVDTILSDYNIFYLYQPGFIQIANASYNDLLSVQTEFNMEIHSRNVDPLFMDMENNDFRLQQNSPAIETGIDIGLTRDKFGSNVPYGNFPDIGVQETNMLISQTDNGIYSANNYLKLFPNPNNGIFIVKLYDDESESIQIEVIDKNGKQVYSQRYMNEQDMNFNLQFLNPGVYFLIMKGDDRQYYQKFIKLE